MSTRGNYVFIDVPLKVDDELIYIKDENGNFIVDVEELNQLEKTIDDELLSIKYGQKIYVHSDNYPSGAIPPLLEFLNTNGAKRRVNDDSYLAAWFTTYKCLEMLPYTRSFYNNDFKPEDCVNPSYEDLVKSADLFGVGLITSISYWANYTYVICPELKSIDEYETTGNSIIYVYKTSYIDKNCKFIDKFKSTDSIEELKQKDWWD